MKFDDQDRGILETSTSMSRTAATRSTPQYGIYGSFVGTVLNENTTKHLQSFRLADHLPHLCSYCVGDTALNERFYAAPHAPAENATKR